MKIFLKNKNSLFTMSLVLLASVMFSCKKSNNAVDDTGGNGGKPVVVVDNDLTDITTAIQAGSSVIGRFISDQTFPVTEGITQTQIVYKRKDSLPMKIFILKVDMSKPNLGIQAMSPYNDRIWGVQTITEMCRDNQKPGRDIMAAINGDFYNTTTGEPTTVFYVDGVAIKSVANTTLLSSNRMFFATYKDGSLKIGGKDRTNALRVIDYAQVDQAVGGGHWLVDNGVKRVNTDMSIEPRTAIGYTTGKMIYVLVADGRNATVSNGLSLNDSRDILFSLGVIDAINLDGGGSTTLAVRNGTSWSVANYPSGGGVARLVGNGLAFVLKK